MGTFKRKIVVNTNDPAHAREVLECVARVLVPIKATPRTAQFERVPRDAPAQHRTIELLPGDGGPISPSLLDTRGPGIQAKLREIEPGQRYALDVTVSPPWPNEPVSGLVRLQTGVPQAPQMSIRVFARVLPRVEATPKHLRLSPRPGSVTSSVIRFRWHDGPPGKLLGAACDDPNVTVTVKDTARGQQVYVQVPPGYQPARASSAVTIRTDDPQAPTVRVLITYRRATKPGRRAGKGSG